jgi:hypothetical protein
MAKAAVEEDFRCVVRIGSKKGGSMYKRVLVATGGVHGRMWLSIML